MSVRENGTARASLELLYHVSRELAAALDLRTVLRRVLFLCMQSVHATNGSIMVLDEGGRPVESAIVIGGTLRDQVTDQFKAVYEHGLAGWVARNREAALVPSTAEDERWLRRPDDSVERTGVKSAISAPLMARDHLVGVITLVHPAPYYFQEEHLVLLKAHSGTDQYRITG
jgi:GAF domain-containing protein